MQKQHIESIENLKKELENDKSVLALLLAGSLAHGFAKADSDIDVFIVIDENDYTMRKKENRLAFSSGDLCTYEGGYIDGKYVDRAFLKLVATKGSDPARYAFKDNKILFSKIDDLENLLDDIAKYPTLEKE